MQRDSKVAMTGATLQSDRSRTVHRPPRRWPNADALRRQTNAGRDPSLGHYVVRRVRRAGGVAQLRE